MIQPQIILASASPRRKELLGLTSLSFSIQPARGEEVITRTEPSAVVQELAAGKAEEVAGRVRSTWKAGESAERQLIIGADTIVVRQGQILGKPKDREDAFRMIESLQGTVHSVYTGVAVLVLDHAVETGRHVFFEQTKVHVLPMSREDILAYLETGEADDKAGAYGIQGRFGIWVKGIEGDYNNVVGLPVAALWQVLRQYVRR